MASNSLRFHKPSSRELIERIVYQPVLAATIRSLEPRSLGKLINHIGLEDSGELISLAATTQIEKIFDEDLWASNQPGTEERFDGDRFVLWLQVMLEVGERFAAEKLEEFPEDLVVLALQRSILVVDSDRLQLLMDQDDESEMTEKALEASLYEEFDEYMVIARRHDGWDAILAVLIALDANNRTLLQRLLDRCCFLSHEYIEDNGGLYDVLTSEDMLESDLAGEREARRSGDGFVAPTAAAGFLKLARMHDPDSIALSGRDAVTQVYLRRWRRSPNPTPPVSASVGPAANQDVLRLEALIAKLGDEPVRSHATPHSLFGSSPGIAPSDPLLRRVLDRLAQHDVAAHARRLDEIAFLCNVLVAGCPLAERAFRPYEAIVATAAICNLGLERLTGTIAGNADLSGAIQALEAQGADGAFRLGLCILHHEVARGVLVALAKAIHQVEAVPRYGEHSLDFGRLGAAADTALKNDQPWQFAGCLFELHDLFDDAALGTLRNLLGECPVLTGQLAHSGVALYKIDDGHRFIATHADVEEVRNFVAQLCRSIAHAR